MEIVRQVQAALGGAVGKRGALKTLTQVDLIDAATVACVAGKYNLLGTYVTTPQTSMRCGSGRTGVVNEQIGMLYILNKDDQATPVEVPGMYRISIVNSEDVVKGNAVHGVRNDKLNISKTDLTTGFKFPVQGIEAKPYDKIAVFLKPDADVTVVLADCDMKMDCTIYS